MNLPLADGLYRYVYRDVVVGFVVKDGKLVACAPWLQARLSQPQWHFRMMTAPRIGP